MYIVNTGVTFISPPVFRKSFTFTLCPATESNVALTNTRFALVYTSELDAQQTGTFVLTQTPNDKL